MFSLKFVLLYFVIFFIYLNFKLSLFLRFVNYGKRLAESEEVKKDYKRSLDVKKRAQEISVIELKMWYEDSVFRKVSGIEFSEQLARNKYELFLEKNDKFISEAPVKKGITKQNVSQTKVNKDEDDNDDKPLFTIKMKK